MVRNGTIMNQNTQSVSMTAPALICSQVNNKNQLCGKWKSYTSFLFHKHITERRDMQQSITLCKKSRMLISWLNVVQCTRTELITMITLMPCISISDLWKLKSVPGKLFEKYSPRCRHVGEQELLLDPPSFSLGQMD